MPLAATILLSLLSRAERLPLAGMCVIRAAVYTEEETRASKSPARRTQAHQMVEAYARRCFPRPLWPNPDGLAAMNSSVWIPIKRLALLPPVLPKWLLLRFLVTG